MEYKNTYIGSISTVKFIEPSKMRKYNIITDLKYEDTKFDKKSKVKVKIGDTEGKEYKFNILIAMG